MSMTMAEVVSMSTDHDQQQDVSTHAKKSHVRLITDKRREQNRKAQKVYRDKLKRKLEDLEEQVAVKTRGGGHQKHGVVLEERVDDDRPPAGRTGITTATANTTPEDERIVTPQERIPAGKVINFEDAFAAAGDLLLSSDDSSFPAGFGLDVAAESPSPYQPPLPKPTTAHNVSSTTASTTSSTRSPSVLHDPSILDYGNIDMRYIWAMPERPASRTYTPPPTSTYPYLAGSLTTFSPEYFYQTQKRVLTSPNRITPPASLYNSSLTLSTRFSGSNEESPSSLLPDPWINHIRLLSDSNITASLAIGLSLGISQSAYLNDHPSRFPACFVQLTSFDLPGTDSTRTSSLGAAAPAVTTPTTRIPMTQHVAGQWRSLSDMPLALQHHMSSIKKPLQPSPTQLLNSHPSYLDCIIFPRFRERAVQASVDGTLDHAEFFLDLMHGGLVCWGGCAPHNTSTSRKKRRRRDMGDSVAWSTRSWEARRWFLRKWEWLVGSEEEEKRLNEGGDGIWEGSRWWWAVRGEVDEDETDDESGSGSEEEGRDRDDFAAAAAAAEADGRAREREEDRIWNQGDYDPVVMREGRAKFAKELNYMM